MATKLENLTTKLQSALDAANALPDAITLDELTNPGSAATMLEGTEMLDAQGKKVTGTIESKDSSDLTASGATVNVPAGYYAEDASKSVSSGSVNQPTITVDSSGNVKATVSYSSGYISSGSTYGTKALGTGSVSVSGPVVTASAGYYPSRVRKTISSGSVPSPTITVDEDGLITAKTSVSTGYVYAGTKTGTKQLTVQAAQTITPGTSNKTIAAGTYLTGNQTIAGDANLKAENIKSGTSIFGVSGSMQPKEFNIVTTVESGATVTATSGSTTISGTSNGTCTLTVPTAGTWTVKATTNLAEYNETETSNTQTIKTVDTHNTSLTFFRAYITVKTETGAAVTVSKGNTTYTKTATTGEITFRVISTGTWTVTAMGASETESKDVSVSEAKTYTVAVLAAISDVLNDNDWATIKEQSDAGLASNYWSVGDTKQVIINGTVGQTTFSNLSVWAFILGFDHNSSKEGTGKIHFQIGKTSQTSGTSICLIDRKYDSSSASAGYFNMNYSNSNSGGWKSSKMRTVLLGNNNTPTSPLSGSLIAALPSDLRAVMKGTTKYSDNTGNGSNTARYVTATTDYLWLPAEYEIFGTRSCANSAEQNYQKQYTYYANGNSKVKYRHSATSSAASWWLRSVYASYSNIFCVVTRSGSADGYNANFSYGVAPAFAV